ncbi:MAG: MerR family transcriptional regulator [Crocinitomicaceae bacterium]
MNLFRHKLTVADKNKIREFLAHEYFVNKKEYTVRSLDNILSIRNRRNIVNWESKGLLLVDDVEPNVKRYYSFLEVVWIHIIVKLRSFGYPLEDIKKLKHCLFETRTIGELLNFTTESLKNINKNELSINDIKDADPSNQQLTKQLFGDLFELDFSLLNTVLAECIQLRHAVYMAISSKGFPRFIYQEDWRDKDLFSSGLLSQPVVIIPIHEIIREIIQDDNQNFIVPKLGILDEHEWELLQELKRDNLIELNINTQNEEFYILKATTKQTVDPATRLLDHILKDGYQEIQYKTKKGKLVHFTNTYTTRIRIENNE